MQSCNIPLIRRLAPPNPGLLRDAKDCEEWANTDMSRHHAVKLKFGARVASLVDRFNVDRLIEAGLLRLTPDFVLQRVAGAVNGPNDYQPGMSTGRGAPATGNMYPADGGGRCAPYSGNSVHGNDPGCDSREVCGEDSWPIRSRGKTGFPLVGNGVFVSTELFDKPTQRSIVPTYFWAAFYDSAIAGWPRIQGEIVNVAIGNTTQYLGAGQGTEIFRDTSTRVPVQWDRIEAATGATWTVGHPYSADVDLQLYMTVFGYPNQ